MPLSRSVSRPLLAGGMLVVLVMAGLLAVWRVTVGGSSQGAEPFQAFQNLSGFPAEDVYRAYRYAVANPGNVLNYMPCFCGCVGHGDKNNRDCYLDGFDSQGRPIYDPHAAG